MGVITPFDIALWCQHQGWMVVGHNLDLVVRQGETVRVAIIAKDERDHFIAVSPVTIEGQLGIGIIDLVTAEARFARLHQAEQDLLN
jgi:hypothetical protein